MHVFCTQPVLTIIYLNINSVFGIISLIRSLYLTFVKERASPARTCSFTYTILLPDDGQSNRLKHVVQI
jgi:hypothetical protein